MVSATTTAEDTLKRKSKDASIVSGGHQVLGLGDAFATQADLAINLYGDLLLAIDAAAG